ncbi:hypothetical protein acsn021_33760 [Anaerocolumna cellulosilytica]|uniref:Uncharacterized protein n=1 Tax=Anaerocolumna cellulosilytica TaxID=433286 RepID=A0A6S6R724_9FIRM|nr:DUF3021 family protein [Anaerocolumna cellulosilytica]MBB5196801.1 hypothetical protein [Anaerocolumna cellulosilytica]BCJ95807.1 hypothetical protein acsn021_33760 [Anaerocolumna cellulosilytica]
MRKVWKSYLPGICIGFTFSVLFSAIYNIVTHNSNEGYFLSILQLFGFLIVINGMDYLLSYIDFRSYKTYFITELILGYALFMATAFVFHWFSFHYKNLIIMTTAYVAIYTFIHSYFNMLEKERAAYINRLISNKEK